MDSNEFDYLIFRDFAVEEIKKDKQMINNEQLKNNRFYIGSNSVFNNKMSSHGGWGHRTLEGAITQAQSMLQLEGKEEVFIVKIIKVVRRKTAPIEVIDVK